MPKIKNTDPLRLDAEESAFFTRQLQYRKAKTYDVKYKMLKAFTLFPIDASAPSGSTEINYKTWNMVGLSKIISDYANDFPRVDAFATETTRKIYGIGNSYGYSIKEIRRSMLTGASLDQKRANASKRSSDEEVNRIAFSGDTAHNIPGFINYPNITEYTVPNGAGGDTEFDTKTPDEVIKDFMGLITAVVDTTNGVEAPDTMLLPIKQFIDVSSRRMTDGSDKTILKFFLENNMFISNVAWVVELKGAGTGGADRMMVYTRDEDHVTLEIPQVYEQFPPIQKGMEFEIATHQETAGVIVYYPLAVAYGDGI